MFLAMGMEKNLQTPSKMADYQWRHDSGVNVREVKKMDTSHVMSVLITVELTLWETHREEDSLPSPSTSLLNKV